MRWQQLCGRRWSNKWSTVSVNGERHPSRFDLSLRVCSGTSVAIARTASSISFHVPNRRRTLCPSVELTSRMLTTTRVTSLDELHRELTNCHGNREILWWETFIVLRTSYQNLCSSTIQRACRRHLCHFIALSDLKLKVNRRQKQYGQVERIKIGRITVWLLEWLCNIFRSCRNTGFLA